MIAQHRIVIKIEILYDFVYPTFLGNNQILKCEKIFNQRKSKIFRESIICINKPNCKNKQQILAYGINSEFFKYLQSFMKEDYVICESDMLACRISDSTFYTGKGEFIPIVLSIRE